MTGATETVAFAGHLATVAARLEEIGHDKDRVADFLLRCSFSMFPACEHERVYSGGNNPTATPLWFFVCAKCGRVGKAQYKWGSTKRPSFDRPRFAQLMFDHHGDRSFLDDLAKRNAQPAAPSTEHG